MKINDSWYTDSLIYLNIDTGNYELLYELQEGETRSKKQGQDYRNKEV